MQIKTLADISNLNIEQIRQIDPARLSLGTESQDCSLIMQTFERGAHVTASEAAVFATLSRSVQNTIRVADAAVGPLRSYISVPDQDAKIAAEQAKGFASSASPEVFSGTGEKASLDHGRLTVRVGGVQASLPDLGSPIQSVFDRIRDCIPCNQRMLAFLELSPNVNLLNLLEDQLLARLKLLQDIGGLLSNFDSYGDLCEMFSLLNFMCIPDLQRIMSLLMALIMLEAPKLDSFIDLLKALIMPIFAPILLAITALLDQFVELVTKPMECIIDAINQQLSKLQFSYNPGNEKIENIKTTLDQGSKEFKNALTGQVNQGLKQLNDYISDAKKQIEAKLDFYLGEIKAMFGELGSTDGSYVLASFRKLQIVRLLAFVSSVIQAVTKGKASCFGTGKTPELQEIDNFFNTYINPNSPFRVYFDNDNNLVVDEKIGDPSILPNSQNVLEYEGSPVITDTTIVAALQTTSSVLSQPGRSVINCRLEVSTQDVSKVNNFITELNQL